MVPRDSSYGSLPTGSIRIPEQRQPTVEMRKSRTRTKQRPTLGKNSDLVPKPEWMVSVSAATPSKPVVIPTRTKTSKAHRPAAPSRSCPNENLQGHNPNLIPPSVAALLAITNSSQPRGRISPNGAFERRKTIERLGTEEYRHTFSSSSPKSWSILQSPPDAESDVEDGSFDAETDRSSLTSRSTLAPPSPLRSLSYDSFRSLDVDLDFDSLFSSMSPPNLSNRYKSRMRPEKRLSPSIPLSSNGDHPLSATTFPENSDMAPVLTPVSENPNLGALFSPMNEVSTSTFKSNLTASLRMLKLAAKSLSAPSQFQTPATLSPSIKAVNTQKAPTQLFPEGPSNKKQHVVRKGIQLPANIDALPFYLSNQLPAPRVRSSIQLLPYFSSPLSTQAATAPPIFLPATNQSCVLEEIGPRERQQRENSDFLRVVVLEMNMRRAGKLTGDGRARIWLGARNEQAIENKDIMSENGNSIADGAKIQGRVVLDGEVGEAKEIENEEDRLWKIGVTRPGMIRYTHTANDRNIPIRWVAKTPD